MQDTDQEDQTCLDEFQECIEEYQECLEVVQICMYEDKSFNNSDSISVTKPSNNANISETETKTNLVLMDNQNNKLNMCESGKNYLNIRNDSSTQSDKVPSSYHTQTDEKDGYETCIDESLSEEVCANQKTIENNIKTEDIVQTKPVNRTTLVFNEFSVKRNSDLDFAASEPCLLFGGNKDNHIFLDSKQEAELKSYDHHNNDSLGTDEFFLIQYPPDQIAMQAMKCRSEPAVLDEFSSECLVRKSYIRRLEEYYNDYEHCMDNYKVCGKNVEEINDDNEFKDIVVPMRSSSAPDILDSSFVTLTYDPGPKKTRRKSVFTCGYEGQSIR